MSDFSVVAVLTTLAMSFFFYPLMVFGFLGLSVCAEKKGALPALVVTVIMGGLIALRFPGTIAAVEGSPLIACSLVVAYVLIACAWSYYKWVRKLEKIREKFDFTKSHFLTSQGLDANYFSVPEQKHTSGYRENQKKFRLELVAAFSIVSEKEEDEKGGKAESYDYAGKKQPSLTKASESVAEEFQVDDLRVDTAGDKALAKVIDRIKPRVDESKEQILLWMAYWPASMFWYVLYDFVVDIANSIFKRMRHHFQRVSDRTFADMM